MAILLPYTPAAPPLSPGEFSRAAWDEFYRLQQVLGDFLAPVMVALAGTSTLSVHSALTYQRLFDGSPVVDMEYPPGQADGYTGVLTAAAPGIYQVYTAVEVPTFSPPNAYVVRVRHTLTNPGQPVWVRTMTAGGESHSEQRIDGMLLVPVMRGATWVTDASVQRASGPAVNVTVNSLRIIRRVTGLL